MIKAVRLKNCQSWEDTTLNLSTNSPNVLVAENGVGKSVLMKMLKITANPNIYSRKKRKQLIRFGADCAQIIFAFDDGSIGITSVYSERVLYHYKRGELFDFEASYNPPQEMLDRLELITNSKTNFIANIIDTDQDMFLVNTNSNGNVELLQKLADHPVLKEVLVKIDSELSLITDKYRTVSNQITFLENQLNSYQYINIDKLERETVFLETALTLMVQLEVYQNNVEKLSDCLLDRTNYDVVLSSIELLLLLVEFYQKLPKIYYDNANYSDAIVLLNLLIQLMYLPEKLQAVPVKEKNYKEFISNADNYISLLDLLEQLEISMEEFGESNREYDELSYEIQQLYNEIDASGLVLECPVKGKVIYLDEKCISYC